jgi:glucokinase
VEDAAESSVLAIDLGGTQIRTAHIGPDRTVSHRVSVPTADEAGVDVVVDRICEVAGEVRDAARADGLADPIGIGISSPGPLDPWRGVVVAPPNLAGWRDVPLADIVESRVGLPTFLERDANVAVQCEWRYGAARGTQDAIYITVSTGIGGGVILDGRPLLGRDGTAAEVGHLTIDLDGPLCGDGQPGHVEAIASGTGIARAAREATDAGLSPHLAMLARGGIELDAEVVAEAADAGDAASIAILDRAWEALGALGASLVNLLNLEIIVLGGGIAANRPEVIARVRDGILHRAFSAPARRVRVAMAEHGDDVSLIGALPIVNDRIHDPAFRRGTPAEPAAGVSQRSSTT